MHSETALWRLPDPVDNAEFYADVPFKRLLAFLVDTVLIVVIVVALIPLTAFTALFFLGFLGAAVAFLYRWLTIAAGSATPGMRLMAIEFRNHRGERLGMAGAFLHTLIFTIGFGMVLPQVVSIVLMLTTSRGQGLGDMLLGTVAINRAAAAWADPRQKWGLGGMLDRC